MLLHQIHHLVGGPNPAVEVTLLCADAFALHGPDRRPLVDGGDFVDALPLIAPVVDPLRQAHFFEFSITHLSPLLPPELQRFRITPVGGWYGIELVVTGIILDALTVFVQQILPALFLPPASVRIQGSDGTHEMNVGISRFPVGFVETHIHDHAPADEVLQQKSPCKGHVLLLGKLGLQGNFKAISQLGFLPPLGKFYGIPKGLPVCVLPWRMIWKQDFGANDTAFAAVIAPFAVVVAVQLLTGAVGGAGDGGLSCAPFDLPDVKVKQGHRASPPSAGSILALVEGRRSGP